MRKSQQYFQKLFAAYSALLVSVVLALAFFVLFFSSRDQYLKNTQTQLQLASQVSVRIDSSIQAMDRIVNGLLFDETFLEIMQNPRTDSAGIEASKEIVSRFIALDAPLFSTERIIAFDRDNYYTLSKSGENQEYIKEAIPDFPWWASVTSATGNRVILPVHPDSFGPEGALVYSVSRAIMVEGQCLGIIEVQNSYQDLVDICNLDLPNTDIVVFSDDGTVIYPWESQGDSPFDFSDLFTQVREKNIDKGNFSFSSHQFFFNRSVYSGWTTVLYTPTALFPPYLTSLIPLLLLAFGILLLGLLTLMYVITKRLTQPLRNLNEALKDVSLDHLSLSLPDARGIAEIEDLNRSFEEMFRQLKQAIAQNVQARANEERANYLALSAQMNPHTLFNTISMIESVSYMHGDKEVSGLCISLSKMMRYISDYTRRTYTVEDEVQYLNCYATLVSKRYDGRLFIQVQSDSELAHRVIPKFTIQPLVENAVKHGFGCGIDELKICVSIGESPDEWYILVEDSGQGFAPDQLTELWKQFHHCDECLAGGGDVVNQKIGNLALSNIYIRCRIMWKDSFSISLGNRHGKRGAFVKISIHREGGTA